MYDFRALPLRLESSLNLISLELRSLWIEPLEFAKTELSTPSLVFLDFSISLLALFYFWIKSLFLLMIELDDLLELADGGYSCLKWGEMLDFFLFFE